MTVPRNSPPDPYLLPSLLLTFRPFVGQVAQWDERPADPNKVRYEDGGAVGMKLSSTLAPTPTALPPLPYGVVVPDTVAEILEASDDEWIDVQLIRRKRSGRKHVGAKGRLLLNGDAARGKVDACKRGVVDLIEVVAPEDRTRVFPFDDGIPIDLDLGDCVNLTVRFL